MLIRVATITASGPSWRMIKVIAEPNLLVNGAAAMCGITCCLRFLGQLNCGFRKNTVFSDVIVAIECAVSVFAGKMQKEASLTPRVCCASLVHGQVVPAGEHLAQSPTLHFEHTRGIGRSQNSHLGQCLGTGRLSSLWRKEGTEGLGDEGRTVHVDSSPGAREYRFQETAAFTQSRSGSVPFDSISALVAVKS